LSDYCAQGWDNYCELASKNTDTRYPSVMELGERSATSNLTAGEILIRNTAMRKYLYKMIGGRKLFEPFDPTVADSPMISKWIEDEYSENTSMRAMYSVDPSTIDEDIVMDKILMKPDIAKDILINIYKTMKKKGTLHKLHNTKLGKFFKNNYHVFN
jgi:hypothetical protein